MRVLHLIPTLGRGGAERQLGLLLRALSNFDGFAPALILSQSGDNMSLVCDSTVDISFLKKRGNHDPRLLLNLLGVAQRIKPDIIQTWLPQMDVLGGLVAHWTGIPHVLSERSSSAMYASGGWKNRLRVAIGKRAQAVIANSEGGAAYWRAQGARGSVHVVRNALTPPSAEPAPLAQLGLEGKKLLVAAGRLSHEKNVPVLVKAMAGALAKLSEHHGVIFGEGPEREATLALIEATGLSGRLHLGGYAANLSGWLRAADVFVSASLMEGHPNVVIEAAAAGCPLVLSDIPAHREFAEGDSALFAPANQATALAEAMVMSVNSREQTLIRAARAQALTLPLSAQAAAQRHLEIYRSLLKQAPHS
jgi:glycosyltransferase involved in cell wall biosynthesis